MLSRSDWIALSAVLVAAVVGFPGLMQALKPAQADKDRFNVELDDFNERLVDKEELGEHYFSTERIGRVTIRNTSDRPIDLLFSGYQGGTEFTKEGVNIQRTRVPLDAYRSVQIQIRYAALVSFETNEALNNIYRKSGGKIEEYLRSRQRSITGVGRPESVGYGLRCADDQQQITKDVDKFSVRGIVFSVSANSNGSKHCYVGSSPSFSGF